jgi:uncharacterized protein (DUF2132 family)
LEHLLKKKLKSFLKGSHVTGSNSNDPLHGITLEKVLIALVEKYGWEDLATRIKINCFSNDPSIKSSLKFLRKTPWARKKVEGLYIGTIPAHKRK